MRWRVGNADATWTQFICIGQFTSVVSGKESICESAAIELLHTATPFDMKLVSLRHILLSK